MKNLKLNPFFGLSALALAMSACGPQAYVPSTIQSNQSAAGTLNIPPKVDIVMGISQDGTMSNIASGSQGLQADVQGFINTLKAKNWDYRFIAIPLNEYEPGATVNINNKVSVSKYDGNYATSGDWVAPYPNANPATSRIAPYLFASLFSTPGMTSAYNNAHETGLRNQVQFLNRSDVLADFLRPDALLSVITLSNGDDHSTNGTYQYCHASGGSYYYDAPPSESVEPYGYWKQRTNGSGCVNDYDYVSQPNKINYALNKLVPVKQGNLSLMKYYALVAGTSSCRGMASRAGLDYGTATRALGPANHVIDICPYTQTAATALTQVANDLTQQSAIFRKVYLTIGSVPDVSTIKVTKISNGVSTTIPQDSVNGWSYLSVPSNAPVYAIDAFQLAGTSTWIPYNASPLTGYVLKLNGNAALIGGDTATVQYMNSGGQVVAQ